MWAGHAAIGSGCPEPVVPEDGVTDPRRVVSVGPLDDLPTWDRSRYQSAVTCQIVQTAADAIGSEAMTAVLAELLASPTPVGVTDWLVEVAVASDGETVDAIRAVIGAGRALRLTSCDRGRTVVFLDGDVDHLVEAQLARRPTPGPPVTRVATA